MSQPDLISALREARPAAPPELRERIRLIAVEATDPPRRRITWRRTAIILIPAAAAIFAAVVLLPGSGQRSGSGTVVAVVPPADVAEGLNKTDSPARAQIGAKGIAGGAFDYGKTPATAPAPSATRLQRYKASLDLELRTPTAVSAASRKAVAIAASLSGYQQSVTVRTAPKTGYAHLVLRVPSQNVREAIRRLSALGTITGENVSIQDVQVQVNVTDARIARLQAQLAAVQAQPQTTETQQRIASLTTQIQRLQRTRAATVRAAHYATVELQMTTPEAAVPVTHEPGPLHGLGVAFRWIAIGGVYALALGLPFAALAAAAWLLARAVRRRREDSLLSSP